MDDWEKFYETKLRKKEEFYSNLNIEVITDPDNMYGKRVCKDFETKNLVDILWFVSSKWFITFGWYFWKR